MKRKQTAPAPAPPQAKPELPADRAAGQFQERLDWLADAAQPLYPEPAYLDALCVAAAKSQVSLCVNLRTGQVDVHAHMPYALAVRGVDN